MAAIASALALVDVGDGDPFFGFGGPEKGAVSSKILREPPFQYFYLRPTKTYQHEMAESSHSTLH